MASHRCESVQELSGDWRLCWDRRNRGREQRWASRVPRGARRAPVPGVIQQVFAKGEGVFW